MKKIATVLILGAFFLSSHLPVLASTQNLKESLKSSEQKNITLNKETEKEKVTSNQKNTHSLWGPSNVYYDAESETATIEAGVLGSVFQRPEIVRQAKKIVFKKGVIAPENCDSLFSNDLKATTIEGLENFDTSQVFNMRYMFNGASVTHLDLSNFDTSKDKNIVGEMFFNADNLVSLKLGRKVRIADTYLRESYGDYKWEYIAMLDGSQPSNKVVWSSGDFMSGYDGTEPGTYEFKPQEVSGGDIKVRYVNKNGEKISDGHHKATVAYERQQALECLVIEN